MKIFRHKENQKLYTIEFIKPWKKTGNRHYKAKPYKWRGKLIKFTDPKDLGKLFDIVSET